MALRREFFRNPILRPAFVLAAIVGCSPTSSVRTPEHSSAQFLNAGTSSKLTAQQAADIQFAMGRTLEETDKPTEAEVAYREVLKKDPRRGDAHARLAVLCDRRADVRQSGRHFAEALKLDPRNPEILCDQGYSFYAQRRWADAETSLRSALAVDARHARSHSNLGLVLARQGDETGALDQFLAAGCDPSDSRSNLGLVLAMEGRFAESQRAYRSALASKPGSPVAREGLRAVSVAMAGGRSPASLARETGPVRDESVRKTSAELPPLPALPRAVSPSPGGSR